MYRCRDIIFSFILLLVFLIPMIIISMYLSLIFRGNFIFIDRRIGQNNQIIRIFKFKTMYDTSDPPAFDKKGADDVRIIKFGKFIRKHRLDELPQLLNIISGNISLVGPRPEQQALAKKYSVLMPDYELRHKIKPGLTGLAQIVQGHVTSLDETKRKLELDLLYINNRSLKLDFKIIFKTIKVVISGKGGK